MRKTKKITTAILLICALIWGILPAGAFAADEYVSSATLTYTNNGITETSAGSGYTISGTTLTFTAAGVYTVTGSCEEGNIIVKKGTAGVVLILSDLTLSCSSTAPLACNKTTAVTLYIKGNVTLTDNENTADDGVSDTFEGAAIKAKSGSSLTIEGNGALNALGANCKNGIKGGSEATVTVNMTGALNVSAANNGIAADDEVIIKNGDINVTAGNEGIKSEPEEDDTTSKGTITIYGGNITVNTVSKNGGDGIQASNGITIYGGTFDIDAYSDGIQSNADLTITNGVFDIKTLNGYNGSGFNYDTMSCKGLKASASDDEAEDATNTITISGGAFKLNTADDAVHSDGYIVITGGTFDIYTGDDGVHADTSLTLGSENGLERDPYITVNYSYEGLESGNIYIYSGKYYVYSTDDGINAAGGSSSGSDPGAGGGNHFNPGGRPGRPGDQGFPGTPGGGMPGAAGDYSINIYGGNVYVNAQGDGIDSNGKINLTGGNIEVWGQSSGDNEPLDSDGELYVNGATVFAAGCTGMGVASPKSGSQTYKNYTNNRVSSGSVITVNNGSTAVYAAKAPKAVSYIFFSSPTMNSSYTVSTGSGTVNCKTGSAFTHTWDNGVVTTPATETETGVITYTCTVCGETERQTVPTVTVIDEEEEETPEFTAYFIADEHVSVNVYYKQSYETPDETDVSATTVRNGDTGEPDGTGSGQINIALSVADGYEIDSITIDGGYKNLKDISETEGINNLYRITKITSDITVTVTTKEKENDLFGDINGDDKVNNKDIVTLFRIVSQGVTEYNKIYDINNDGKVNNKDVVSLFRAVNAQ